MVEHAMSLQKAVGDHHRGSADQLAVCEKKIFMCFLFIL
jgi:hypothetical protein